MWIRSQNKYTLINCKNIFIYHNTKTNKFIIATNDGGDIVLGIYSTEEKAKKVLDKIIERIKDIHCNNYRRDIVFQIPQDDEVDLDLC